MTVLNEENTIDSVEEQNHYYPEMDISSQCNGNDETTALLSSGIGNQNQYSSISSSNGFCTPLQGIINPKATTGEEHREPAAFDDALAETKFGKLNIFIIFISGIIIAYSTIETIGISFILPVSQCDLNLTTSEKGVLSAIGFIGIITSSHLWGFLADKYGRRKVIRPTLFMASLFATLSSFSANYWSLIILRYFTGFFASGGSATIFAYLGEFHTNKVRTRAIMAASTVYAVTFTTLPLLAMLVINQDWSFYIPFLDITYKPWRLFFVVLGLPAAFCGLCLFIIPESPKYLLSQNKDAEALEILRKIYSINTGKSKDTYKIESIEEDTDFTISIRRRHATYTSNPFKNFFISVWEQTAPLFMKKYLRQSVLSCLIQFINYATSNGMYMWFPTILNQMMKFTDENPGYKATMCSILSSSARKFTEQQNEAQCTEKLEISTYEHSLSLEIMYIFGFAIIGLIINAVGKIPILFVVLVGCGACGVFTILTDIPLLAVYFYVILLLCGLANTVINAITVDLYPTNLRAMAVCISLMMGRLGAVVGTNIAAALLDQHCKLAFLTSGLSLIVAGFLCCLITIPRQKTSSQHQLHHLITDSSTTGNHIMQAREI